MKHIHGPGQGVTIIIIMTVIVVFIIITTNIYEHMLSPKHVAKHFTLIVSLNSHGYLVSTVIPILLMRKPSSG